MDGPPVDISRTQNTCPVEKLQYILYGTKKKKKLENFRISIIFQREYFITDYYNG